MVRTTHLLVAILTFPSALAWAVAPPADNCERICEGNNYNYDGSAQITSYMATGGSGPKDATGGKNESPSGVKPLDACLEKFMKGEAKMVLVAVPQEGEFKPIFGKCVRIKALDEKAGKCVPVFAGDHYGTGSNGKEKMDVSHCDGGAAQQGHGDSTFSAQTNGERGGPGAVIPRQ